MSPSSMKLYRGLSADEFKLVSKKMLKENKLIWSSILKNRAQGEFGYPDNLDRPITLLQTNMRLEYQYFTDSKMIAEGYVKKIGGLLIELNIPIKDILNYFDLEFQNFSRRKKKFELVYRVKGSLLLKNSKKWGLKVGKKEMKIDV